MEFIVIIPVRYRSERLPYKALLDIGGKPMVQHVYERAQESGAKAVIVATDSTKVQSISEGFGAKVVLTAPDHPSGTDRILEVATAISCGDNDIIINVQGDEPLLPPEVINQVACNLVEHDNAKVATLCQPATLDEVFDPNVVKVVCNRHNFALYFSRAPIAWERDTFSKKDYKERVMQGEHWRHIGIYAYRFHALQQYVQWDLCPIETMEKLEQLRLLWHGGGIYVDIAKKIVPHGVDTPEDLERVRALFDHESR